MYSIRKLSVIFFSYYGKAHSLKVKEIYVTSSIELTVSSYVFSNSYTEQLCFSYLNKKKQSRKRDVGKEERTWKTKA